MKSFEHFGMHIQAGVLASLFAILLTLPAISDAEAHGINLFCRLEGPTLHGEAYFSGGNPAKNSTINIYAIDTGKLLASGATSSEGKFSIPFEKKVPIKVVLDDGQGHRASWTWNKTSKKEIEPQRPVSKKPFPTIIAGIAAIAVIFGILYLWKRRDAA